MKNIFTCLLLCLFAATGMAEDFEYSVGSVRYFVHGNDVTQKAEIKFVSKTGPSVTGELDIPGVCQSPKGVKFTITKLAYQAFADGNMTKVTLPNSIDSIGVEAFVRCRNLKTIIFNDGLRWIGNQAFIYCSALGNLTLPTSLVEISDGAFYHCQSIQRVNFSELTSLKRIGKNAFSLNGLPGYDKNVHGLRGDLVFAEGLERVEEGAFFLHQNFGGKLGLPSTLKHFGDLVFNGNGDFVNFTGELNLPDNLEYIGTYAFCRWPRQTPIKLPSNVKHIGQGAFFRSSVFEKNLVLPASLEIIGVRAFYFCQTTNNITVEPGSKLKAIYDRAFLNPYLNFVDLRNAPITDFTKYIAENGEEVVYADDPFNRSNEDNIKAGFMNGLNPYTLVYLPKGMTNEAVVPAEAINVIQTTEGGSLTCKNFVVYDDYQIGWAKHPTWDYNENPNIGDNLPYAQRGCDYGKAILDQFTATNARYVRTFPENKISSVYLPYEAKLPQGMTAYKLQCKLQSGQLYFLSIDDPRLNLPDEEKSTLKAYTPYLLRVEDATQATFSGDSNVTVATAKSLDDVKTENTTADKFAFVGSIDNIYHDDAKNLKAYTLRDNIWYQIKDQTEEQIQTNQTSGFVHSFRAFILPPSGSSSRFAMIVEKNETVSGIEDLKTDLNKATTNIYTIEGRLVGRDFNSLPAGLYVMKGKKIYKF